MIAAAVVGRLEGEGAVHFAKREAAVDHVARTVTEDLQVEDRLNDEVREMLRNLADEMNRQNIQYHEMFKLIKAKLVRERKLIL